MFAYKYSYIEMIPPKIEQSSKEERREYVLSAWECLHDCELCGKALYPEGKGCGNAVCRLY